MVTTEISAANHASAWLAIGIPAVGNRTTCFK